MNIGIVGAEGTKFTPLMEARARRVISDILVASYVTVTEIVDNRAKAEMSFDVATTLVSGGCHLGGIDIWAEEIADQLGISKIIHKPQRLQWSGGYRERNLLIARDSDIVHNIVVAGYHSQYQGMRFKYCYHCKTDEHVKSGGCWTAKRAKKAEWHVIPVIE